MELNKIFIDGLWSKEINVADFVSNNIAPYTGDASFLQGPTQRTLQIWDLCLKAIEEEVVCILYSSSLTPCIIQSTESEDYKYFILPIRLHS